MRQEYFFGDAKWVGARERREDTFSVLRGRFDLASVKHTTLRVLGLGFFKCYINGVCINPDTFLPLSSDYEKGCDPVEEVLSHHRIYVPEFDITAFLRKGENVIALEFGGGWYTHKCRTFGLPKAIYCITVEGDESQTFVSNEKCRISHGRVSDYSFTRCEKQDYSVWQECTAPDFDDSGWDYAALVEAVDTDYSVTDCPADALIEELPCVAIGKTERGVLYDCGQNTVGYPVLSLTAQRSEEVSVYFSEDLRDGYLDPAHTHDQSFSVISDGCPRSVQAEFTWYGFRYFEVVGNALPECVKVVHASVPVTSTFSSDNETLNWAYRTFVHTMLCNMHTGIPSDCPHLERRGYTGDGQLTCHAVLSIFDAVPFYEKWLQDIADGQDLLSGHVQYTAPYIRSGGGPGGWGGAIVEVPYQLYRHTGNKEILARYYDNMRRYIDYLEAHSEFGLVTSDKEGEWCLGDWCEPNVLYPEKEILCCNQQVILPVAMINTYFMVKSLEKMQEIARIIGRSEDIADYEEKAKERRSAIRAAYFNAFDGNFIMNAQGANAFAVDIGLGNEKTYSNMVNYYRKLGCYDTGIFATDVLTRVLFENGDGDLASELLTSNGRQGYERWRQNGATTFHEYWDSNRSRSHNHPMFGASVAYFFEYLLGIKQADGSAGYKSLSIKPQATTRFSKMSGSIKTPRGTVSVRYERSGDDLRFSIILPDGTDADFECLGQKNKLSAGVNELVVKAK